MPDQAQEIRRLEALVAQMRQEVDLREAEWRLRNLPPGGDVSGADRSSAVVNPMDTREESELLSQTTTGGTGAGRPGVEMLVHKTLSAQQQQAVGPLRNELCIVALLRTGPPINVFSVTRLPFN